MSARFLNAAAYLITLQAHVVHRFPGSSNDWPDAIRLPLYVHGWPMAEATVAAADEELAGGKPKKLQGSLSHRGQQSPGCSGSGLSQVNGGHSNFQQSYSPY